MTIRIFDPKSGQAFQGDVMIAPLPKDIRISADAEELPLKNGMLVIAEGEVTGHHHAFRYGLEGVARFRDDGLARSIDVNDNTALNTVLEKDSIAQIGAVHLFRDLVALAALVKRGLVTEQSLCIGFLHVEEGAPPLTHDEHNAIQFPAGEYYVAGKREWNVGEQQRVAD